MQAIVLAAGKGTRMKSQIPKVLHEALGVPLLGHVLKNLEAVRIEKPVVVVGAGADQVKAYLGKRAVPVLQAEQRGTGHAVLMAAKALEGYSGDVIIWPGDMPLVKLETLKLFLRKHRSSGAAVSVLSAIRSDPSGYGRILRRGGEFCGIREELDASEDERRICEVNTGVYIFDKKKLFTSLKRVRPQNKKNEIYLTDTIEILAAAGDVLKAFPLAESDEGQGVNSKADLAEVMKKLNERHIREHQDKGVTFVFPEQTLVCADVKIGQDTVIYPWTFIESGVRIGSGCHVGPFAKIRSGTVIGDSTVIGSFVEVNRSKIGKKVSAKHLSYLGDAVIGDGTNIGAGTITANYDGKQKHQTRIGKNVMVGSDTVFVAPVSVSDFARTGAGAVLTAGTVIKKGQVAVGVPAKTLNYGKAKS